MDVAADPDRVVAAADAVIVLGKELRRDPARAIRELRARSAAASIALRQGVPVAVTLEAPLRGQVDAGSALVSRLLAELGVEAARIHAETVTRSTREEAVRSAELARRQGWARLLVVTAGYHRARAQRYFNELDGVDAVVLTPEDLRHRAVASEADWIARAAPDPQALGVERRSERTFLTLARLLRPLPKRLRWRLEIRAGALLRGVGDARDPSGQGRPGSNGAPVPGPR